MDYEIIKQLRDEGMAAFGRYYGFFEAVVIDNQDPEDRERLKVQVPEIHGTQVPEYWALPSLSAKGAASGQFWVPAKQSNVWVWFKHGNPEWPYWAHGWWIQGAAFDNAKGKAGKVFGWQTPGGMKIWMDDESQTVRMQSGSGLVYEVGPEGISIGKMDGSSYKAVLGEKTVEKMSKVLDLMAKITVTTPLGTSSIPLNAPEMEALAQTLKEILSTKVTLE